MSDQIPNEMERVLDAMVEAGWMHCYTMTDGKGLHLTATAEGVSALAFLKRWEREFGIVDRESRVMVLRPVLQGRGFGTERGSDADDFRIILDAICRTDDGLGDLLKLHEYATVLKILDDDDESAGALRALFVIARNWGN